MQNEVRFYFALICIPFVQLVNSMQYHFILSQLILNHYIFKISMTLLSKNIKIKMLHNMKLQLYKSSDHLWIKNVYRVEILYFYP